MKKFNLRTELEPEYWKDEVEFVKCLVAMDRDRRKAHAEQSPIILEDDDLDDEEDFEEDFDESLDDDFDDDLDDNFYDDDDDLDEDAYTERARGEWVKVEENVITAGGDPIWICSKCGKGKHVYGTHHRAYNNDISDLQWIACPNCGAIMVEKAD